MSLAHKGQRQSPEQVAKRVAARRWYRPSAETRVKMSKVKEGSILSPEHKAKISAGLKGHRLSVETKAKIAAVKTGVQRKPFTLQHLANMSAGRIGLHAGAKNPQWRGGISKLPYAWTFNNELRAEVRRRDKYKCQICGALQMECKRKLCVHHIDYDKKNSDPINLISLCLSCHMRTNVNRKYWTEVFQEMAIKAGIADLSKES